MHLQIQGHWYSCRTTVFTQGIQLSIAHRVEGLSRWALQVYQCQHALITHDFRYIIANCEVQQVSFHLQALVDHNTAARAQNLDSCIVPMRTFVVGAKPFEKTLSN